MGRLSELHESQTAVCLDDAFAALASDIITDYCFGTSWGFLKAKNFGADLRAAISDTTDFTHFAQLCPWFVSLIRMLPISFLRWIQPGKASVIELLNSIYDQAAHSLNDATSSDTPVDITKEHGRKSIFDPLVDSSVPAGERTLQRLQDEGFMVFGAGAETTARVLSIASFYLASHKDISQRLRAELQELLPTPTSTANLVQLEKLPYLV